MTKRYLTCAVFVALVLFGSRLARAEGGEDEGRGEKLLHSDLVRVTELSTALPLSAFLPAGSDTLREGEAEVRRKRELGVKVEGAVASAAYGVLFCPFGQPQSSCLALGSLFTDSEGKGEARLAFLAAGNTWAGGVLLTRDAKNQFISGLSFPPAEEVAPAGAGEVEVELKGRIASLNPANTSFRLVGFPVDIFVGASTRFKKVGGFAALFVGLRVEVKGFSRPDGTVFATEVKAEQDDD